MSVSAAERRDVVGSSITTVDIVVPGYNGGADHAPSVDQLAWWAQGGELRLVLSGSGGMGGSYQQERHAWIEQHCDEVDSSAYGGPPEPEQPGGGPVGMGAQALYDCDV